MIDLTDEQRRKIAATQKPKRSVAVTNLAGIVPQQAHWLWFPYLPLGKVVIVAGAPGHGKSQLAALIAGMATRASLPGDVTDPSRVLMLCAEDDLDTTVVPRLMAVNADLRLVDTINVVTEYPSGLTGKGLIRVPGDVDSLHTWARDNANARLIVMDPVASFFGREHNTLFNQDVRDALGPVVAIAEAYGITVVVILHLNKSESKDMANRIAESHGFQALARSVLALGPDPDDPLREKGNRRVLAMTKANLVKPGAYSLRCEVRSVMLSALTPPIETSELALVGKCDVSADDLLAPSAERSNRIDIGDWLEEFIGEGWRLVQDVRKAATSDGWSWAMVDRVARAKGYQRSKAYFQGPWWLGAPKAHHSHIPGSGDSSQPSQTSEATEGHEGHEESPLLGDRDRSPSDDANSEGRNGKQGGLDDYRRLRDRMLGEGDDEEPA